MAPTKKAGKAPKGVADPRSLSPQQRRELFLAGRKARKDDWRIIQADSEVEIVPTNNLAFDHGLKFGGLARGGMVYQIHGDEGSGKSTTTYEFNREYQRATDEPVAIFDFERTTTSKYLRAIGLDEDMAFVKRPDSIEDALKDTMNLIGQGVRLFTFDSIPRMRNKVDVKDVLSGDAFKVQPGTHARAIQQFYDIILPHIAAADGTLLMVNQTRSRIESSTDAKSAAKGYETVTNLNYILPGGRANRFAIGGMMEMKLVKAIKPGKADDEWWMEEEARNGEAYLCHMMRVRALKNKITGGGYRQSVMFLRPGQGLDENISIRQMAREYDLISWSGKYWYVGRSVEDAVKVYDSKAQAYQSLIMDQDMEILGKLRNLVIEAIAADTSQLEIDSSMQSYLSGEQEHELDNFEVAESNIQLADADELDGK